MKKEIRRLVIYRLNRADESLTLRNNMVEKKK